MHHSSKQLYHSFAGRNSSVLNFLTHHIMTLTVAVGIPSLYLRFRYACWILENVFIALCLEMNTKLNWFHLYVQMTGCRICEQLNGNMFILKPNRCILCIYLFIIYAKEGVCHSMLCNFEHRYKQKTTF